MKKILIGIISFAFFLLFVGCSSETEPQFRIKNEQISKANVNVQIAAEKKLSINDIEPGKTTVYQSALAGNITVTDVIRNESVSFLAAKNTRYTVIISTEKPPSISIDK